MRARSIMEQVDGRVGIGATRERMRRCAPRRVAAGQRSKRASKSPNAGDQSTNTGSGYLEAVRAAIPATRPRQVA